MPNVRSNNTNLGRDCLGTNLIFEDSADGNTHKSAFNVYVILLNLIMTIQCVDIVTEGLA